MTRPVITTTELCDNDDLNEIVKDIGCTGVFLVGTYPGTIYTAADPNNAKPTDPAFSARVWPARGNYCGLRCWTEVSGAGGEFFKMNIEIVDEGGTILDENFYSTGILTKTKNTLVIPINNLPGSFDGAGLNITLKFYLWRTKTSGNPTAKVYDPRIIQSIDSFTSTDDVFLF